jgi:hypothetical protein
MNEQPDSKKSIIREFCRSQGAPTAYWLARLSAKGQEECIRQWIIKVRSPEFQKLLPAVAEKLYEERANESPYFYEASSAEELLERFASARHNAEKRLEEEVRYGAIEMAEIDSAQPWVECNRYHDLCDREWQVIVEGKPTGFDAWGFFDVPWYWRLGLVLFLALYGLDGLLGVFGKPEHGPLGLGIAGVLILTSIFLATAWVIHFFRHAFKH